MANSRPRGFNPTRLTELARPQSIVPQIVDAAIESQARGFTEVKIVGVGGGGGNAVNRMIEAGVHGVEFIAVNTDAQALQMSGAVRRIQIGGRSAKGLGAGGDPDRGERAAEISRDDLGAALAGADMVFLTAGLGGGTGTGASPVIADIARHERALTVGVVTLPFGFEGYRRRQTAVVGLEELRKHVDALIVIPNDRLLDMADRQMSIVESFRMADDVLRHGVQGISDLVTMTGLINLDFADVKSVMRNAGTALMAIGEGRGDGRAVQAARAAIASPLLDVSIEGATGVLLNVTGGPEMTLAEVTEAAETIAEVVDPEANILFGAVVHPRVQEQISITIIATGLRDEDRLSGTGQEARRRSFSSGRFGGASRPTPSESRPEPPRFSQPEAPRSRDEEIPQRIPAREAEPEYRREPPPRARERDRSRETPQPNGDDWDTPSFLRRPRR